MMSERLDDPNGERFIELTERQLRILGDAAEGSEGTVLGSLDDVIRRLGSYGAAEDIAWDLGHGPHPVSMIGNSGAGSGVRCGCMGCLGKGDGDVIHTDDCAWQRAHDLFAWEALEQQAAAAYDSTATARSAAALEIVGELAESELDDEDEKTVTCLYCGHTMLRGLQVSYIAHRPDCVYLRARRLVGEAGG